MEKEKVSQIILDLNHKLKVKILKQREKEEKNKDVLNYILKDHIYIIKNIN